MPLTDLLYFDRQRLRRLLGELEGGIVESVVNRVGGSLSTRATARIFGEAAGGAAGANLALEETISLDDALLNVAEEALEAAGALRPIAGVSDPDAWETGAVHESLKPAQVISYGGQTQIVDPRFFASSVERVIGAVEKLALFQSGLLGGAKKSQRDTDRMVKAAVTELIGGMSPDIVRTLGEAIPLFFGEQIVMRQLPCGPEFRSNAFVGILSEDPDILLDSRASMYAKYGAAPGEWNVLSQVATVTAPMTDEAGPAGAVDDDSESGDGRADFEGILSTLMVSLETAGLAGGPTWPTITVTPLAIYRRA